jgi:hypothetical protein
LSNQLRQKARDKGSIDGACPLLSTPVQGEHCFTHVFLPPAVRPAASQRDI